MAVLEELRLVAEQATDDLRYDEVLEEAFDLHPVHTATTRGDAARVEVLAALRLDLDVCNADGWAPLHLAASAGQEAVVGILLSHGARPDVRSRCPRSYDGCTPLHLAVAGGHQRVVELLLRAGADTDIRDDCGYTALHLASELGHRDIVKCLVKAGARLNPLVGDDTPLGLALRERRMEVAGLLEQVGAGT